MTPAPEKKSSERRSDDLAIARQALATEIQGLQALHDGIDENFSRSVETIHAMKERGAGRLIVAGIGKSGHVSRKIAATLASTGTPAYFVHPGEASHGDMGMIAQADIVLMLSNSGENAELSDLIHYTRRYGITLIAMTSNPASSLAKHADIILLLPKVPEACPNGLAPTTSTTMMIALGDALAVSLLERMGLTPDQYKVFHPGGKLGQRLKKVSDLMVPIADMPLLGPDATMDKAILLLSEKNLGAVVIVDKNQDLQGIITDGDLKRHMAPDLLAKPVRAVMSSHPRTIESDLLAVKALDIMTGTPGHYLTSLIVTQHGKLAGMIRLQDCLQAGLG
jgi:arabinose-5-phosphate isomerase